MTDAFTGFYAGRGHVWFDSAGSPLPIAGLLRIGWDTVGRIGQRARPS